MIHFNYWIIQICSIFLLINSKGFGPALSHCESTDPEVTVCTVVDLEGEGCVMQGRLRLPCDGHCVVDATAFGRHETRHSGNWATAERLYFSVGLTDYFSKLS